MSEAIGAQSAVAPKRAGFVLAASRALEKG